MKNFLTEIFSKIKTFAKNNKWWTSLIIFVLIILLFVFLGKKKSSTIEMITVSKHDLTEEVSATGNVKALSDLDLAFETSGQVSNVAVSVGDRVYQGEYLASLSNADLAAAVEQAKAGLKAAQAKLTDIQNGTRPEQLAVAQNALNDSITTAYTTCDNAIHNDIDQMFQNPKTSSPKITLPMNDFRLQNTINSDRYTIEMTLNKWNTDTSVSATSVLAFIDTVKNFVDEVTSALSGLSANSSISQVTIDQLKATVSADRSSIDLIRSNITSAKANYDLQLAGNTSASIAGQEATVEQAQANVDAAQAQFAKSIITSPINGVITNVNAKAGQTMQSGALAISVISYGQYDVESYIPEADIAKVKVGDVATTTLDAYGSNTFFPTSVLKIDPGETIIESVPTYKVTLKFASSSDARIKSGMTANLDILTNQKNGVLAVPTRSVYSIDTQKYVKSVDPKDPKKTIETKVETGVRGVDGYVEIISGLKEGDIIVASPNI